MKVFRKIRSWVGSLAIAYILSLLIGIFLLQPYRVDGHSMDPTLRDSQRLFVSKLSHTFSYMPDYGDIVIIDSRVNRERTFMDDVMENPLIQLLTRDEDRIYYVKRVIGKPGDMLELTGGQLYRNGERLEESYIKEEMNAFVGGIWEVPEGHVFVMGDNRNHSDDSRSIGYIPLNHVLGKKL
ncbi:signal peptidase I [Cohnella sp. CIP 111063]|uniref:signal peptidase I n=1 Tax=unclassified Cohnella TaxID=2636738 RepID=UPI000B8BF73C|nr:MULTISPECIES: signal peptidase I [unclassified Cohnella]OXS58797.1 signal peptidase I [Cohnella sp. CIP 111063]PRX71878.1 signal peptidase I [Cohnella sp. SGD-V74]